MNIGRNDICFCGSGKKYKKCCMVKMQNPQTIWKENFDKIDIRIDKKEELKNVMFHTYDFISKNNWQGACHAMSSIQYILLNELGISSKLCIGVVGKYPYKFDHSWIEIDNKIYDITIANGLQGIKVSNPIISSINIESLEKMDVTYGVNEKLDYPANIIKDMSITEYLDGFDSDPEEGGLSTFVKDGIWNLIIKFADNVNLKLDKDYLREKYSQVKRLVV